MAGLFHVRARQRTAAPPTTPISFVARMSEFGSLANIANGHVRSPESRHRSEGLASARPMVRKSVVME
jgi:hypothetical protein